MVKKLYQSGRIVLLLVAAGICNLSKTANGSDASDEDRATSEAGLEEDMIKNDASYDEETSTQDARQMQDSSTTEEATTAAPERTSQKNISDSKRKSKSKKPGRETPKRVFSEEKSGPGTEKEEVERVETETSTLDDNRVPTTAKPGKSLVARIFERFEEVRRAFGDGRGQSGTVSSVLIPHSRLSL